MKYIIIINVLAFALFGMDKRFAQKGNWRIPEKLLFITSIFGGAAGAIVGMYFFHHKTLHKSLNTACPAHTYPQYCICNLVLFFFRRIAIIYAYEVSFWHSLKKNVCPYFDLQKIKFLTSPIKDTYLF